MSSVFPDACPDIEHDILASHTSATSETVNDSNYVFCEEISLSNGHEEELNHDVKPICKNSNNLIKLTPLNVNSIDSNAHQVLNGIVEANTKDHLKLVEDVVDIKNENELSNLKINKEKCNSSATSEKVESVADPNKNSYLDDGFKSSGKDSTSTLNEFKLCSELINHSNDSMDFSEQSIIKSKTSPEITLDLQKHFPSKVSKKTYKEANISDGRHDDEEKLISFMKELRFKIKLEQVTSLNLINLGLKAIEYDFSPLINVANIDVSNNELTSLPDSFSCFKQCTRLILSNNKFTEIPIVLYKYFYFIKDLDISNNSIVDFSMAPLCITYLVNLNASHNKMVVLPRWILHDIPSCLKSLNMSFNPCFKERMGSLFCDTFETNTISSRVTELDISSTGFNSMNIQILKMFTSVRVLRMSSSDKTLSSCCNSIVELPGDYLNQMPLEELHVEKSNLTCLPENIDKMSHLKVLEVSNNNISWFPEKVVNLECLSIVVASKCSLAYLPEDMGCLTSLSELWLSHNDISSLPDLKNCKRLTILDLYSNSFYQIPCTLAYLKLEALDICGNYFNPASYKQAADGVLYENLKISLREKLVLSGTRLDSIKIDRHSRSSSYSGSYSSSLKSWGSYKSSRSRRSTPSSSFERQSLRSKQDESWDVDPDDAWDPDLYSDLKKWTSEDSLSRCRFLAPLVNRENYFCPYRETSNFYQNLYIGYTGADEQGQFEDA